VHAKDGADPRAVVRTGTPLLEALAILEACGRDGLVVVTETGALAATCSAAQLLALVLPDYYEDDPALAAVVTDAAGLASVRAWADQPIGALLARDAPAEQVPAGATMLEVATRMATRGAPLVAVVDGGRVLGGLDARTVLAAMLGPGR
jgi:CBS domain-containing protein